MRKRAQLKMPESTPSQPETARHEEVKKERKQFHFKKNWWISICLIAVFFLVLFLNTYFNFISNTNINPDGTTLSDKFYVSGPDPYYNLRLVEQTMETGQYPYYGARDPLLNYPLGQTGGRAPLLVMSALGFSRFLVPFMSEMDAVGYSMQFVPALFGALLVFPVYYIGKTLFGRKEGLLAAFLLALIPIHIGSGHGSAYGLFDHDSINLFLFFMTFMFLVYSIKEKDRMRSFLYACLGGTALGALALVWTEAEFLFTVIAVYAVVQIIIDIFLKKIEIKFWITTSTILLLGYFISLPVIVNLNRVLSLPLLLGIFIAVFGLLYVFLERKKIPWILSLPTIFAIGAIATIVIVFTSDFLANIPGLSPLVKIANIIKGTGIYGNKVSLTIAEAHTSAISSTVMSYGPAIYWLAWAGFIFLIYQYAKQKWRRDYLFIIVLFIINIWLTGLAGRFLNDMVPVVALLSAWITVFLITKVDYKQMVRNIRNAGGGFRGLRKGIRIYHILGVLFVVFLILLPNGYLALDAAVPRGVLTKNGTSTMKLDYLGMKDDESAFGAGSGKEQYWVDALTWLSKQDTNIEPPENRPAFISWWDYGFYTVAVGDHPVVADNFQDGIPPAANFHTSTTETEAVAIWIVRMLEGTRAHTESEEFSPEVIAAFDKYLDENTTHNITNWFFHPDQSPSYHTIVGEPYYGEDYTGTKLLVGDQYSQNAYYHDISQLFNSTLSDEQITNLYKDIQKATGYNIRYYGVEGYDMDIFNVFTFLADKGSYGFTTSEDDYFMTQYTDKNGKTYNISQVLDLQKRYTQQQIYDLQLKPGTVTKDAFYNTMVYRVYKGLKDQAYPTFGLRHFALKYISKYPYGNYPAVIIAKYYEGAYINGTIFCNGTEVPFVQSVVYDEFEAPHDYQINYDGNYSLLVPGGNITLRFAYYGEVPLKEIRFNQTGLFAPISEEEATREVSDYTRIINITVNTSTLEGYLYENKNSNTTYEPGIDTPLAGVTVQLIDEFSQQGTTYNLITDAQGHYIATNLFPSKYNVSAIQNGFTLHSQSVIVSPDHHYYNMSKPLPAAVSGTTYYDWNKDLKYNAGEEVGSVHIDLLYTKLDGTKMLVNSLTSSAQGAYSFTSLVPGAYTLNATKLNASTGYHDYSSSPAITIAANTTLSHNLSLRFTPIKVSGITAYQGTGIKEVTVTFKPDSSVANNTAVQATATTDANGAYSASIYPGTYNITVDKKSGATPVYSFTGHLVILRGEGVKTYPIALVKHSVTVSGTVTYNSLNKANITIPFTESLDIENNTAIDQTVLSTATGYIAELAAGSYNINITQLVNENGVNATYTYRGQITILPTDTIKTYNIVLTRVET